MIVLIGVSRSGGQLATMLGGTRFAATNAGQMQLTAMLSSRSSVGPTLRVRPSRPCLEAQYCGAKAKGYSAAEEAVITMLGLKSSCPGDEVADCESARCVLRA